LACQSVRQAPSRSGRKSRKNPLGVASHCAEYTLHRGGSIWRAGMIEGMEPNPYETPRADVIVARHRAAVKRNFKIGLAMVASAFLLPFLAWALAHGFVAFAASLDPVPNQGAMLLAFV